MVGTSPTREDINVLVGPQDVLWPGREDAHTGHIVSNDGATRENV